MMTKKIAVHSQSFHADDSLAIYFLLQTSEFKNAEYIRTRDQSIIDECDAAVDVGLIYDHDKRRYDHHQKGFEVTFPNSKIPLASCGLVYLHFGEEINANILKKNGREIGDHSRTVYTSLYDLFVKEIDANDNGKPQYPITADLKFKVHSSLSERIAMMNDIGTFDDAIELAGLEYENRLLRFFDSDVPAIDIGNKAFQSRFNVDESGLIILNEFRCSIDHQIKESERIKKTQILYTVSPRDDGSWNVRAINSTGFELRKPLPFAGLRDEELSLACGIEGAIFVHKNAFLATFNTKEEAILFAQLAVKYDNNNKK